MKYRTTSIVSLLFVAGIASGHFLDMTANEEYLLADQEVDGSTLCTAAATAIKTVVQHMPANTVRWVFLNVSAYDGIGAQARITLQSSGTGPTSGFVNRWFIDANNAAQTYGAEIGDFGHGAGTAAHWHGDLMPNITAPYNDDIWGWMELKSGATQYWYRFEAGLAAGSGGAKGQWSGGNGRIGNPDSTPFDIGDLLIDHASCPGATYQVSEVWDGTNMSAFELPAPVVPRANLTGPDGAIYGGDRAAYAALLGVTPNAVDALYSLTFILLGTAIGFAFINQSFVGAVIGAVIGVALSIAMGVMPAWVVALFGIVGTAAYLLLRGRGE